LLVAGVEQVCPVDVHLDAGLRLRLAVGVAADVVPALEHQDLQPELGGTAFGARESEEAGPDDDEISVQGVAPESAMGGRRSAPDRRRPPGVYRRARRRSSSHATP